MTEIIKANNIALPNAAAVPEIWLRRKGAQAHRPGIPRPQELAGTASSEFKARAGLLFRASRGSNSVSIAIGMRSSSLRFGAV